MTTHVANPIAGYNNTAMSLRATSVAASLAKGEKYVLVRSGSSLSAADSGPWNNATWATTTYGVACDGYETVFVTAKFGGTETLRVSPMFYDPDTTLWMSPIAGGAIVQSESLDGSGNQLAEVRVAGMHCVFFRISALSGSITNYEVAIYRGAPRGIAVFG